MPVDQKLTSRTFGIELEVILPRCPSKLPAGGSAPERVAKFLRSKGIQAMTEEKWMPTKTRDYFKAVAEKTAAEKPLPAWLQPTPRHAMPNPMGMAS